MGLPKNDNPVPKHVGVLILVMNSSSGGYVDCTNMHSTNNITNDNCVYVYFCIFSTPYILSLVACPDLTFPHYLI